MQVVLDENEPMDSGMRRFRREVMSSNLLMEVGWVHNGAAHACAPTSDDRMQRQPAVLPTASRSRP